jgi:hypothetical protein
MVVTQRLAIDSHNNGQSSRSLVSARSLFGFLLLLVIGCGGLADEPDASKTAKWIIEQGGMISIFDSDREYKEIAKIPKDAFAIEKVDLISAKLTNADLKNLVPLKNVKSLTLYQVQITDAGLDHLAGLTTLTELELSHTKITDAGLVKLKTLTNLRKLHVRGTVVTKEGIDAFKQTNDECEVFYR